MSGKLDKPMGLNPIQVKRRENLGIMAIAGGVALLLLGLVVCTSSWGLGITLVLISAALGLSGANALTSIPDLLTSADESF